MYMCHLALIYFIVWKKLGFLLDGAKRSAAILAYIGCVKPNP